MRIAIGSDHAGFELKVTLRRFISDLRHDPMDFHLRHSTRFVTMDGRARA